MAVQVWKNCKLYTGGYNLSGDMNQIELVTERAAKEITVFGDGTEHTIPGLFKTSFNHKGFYQVDSVNPKVDDILTTNLALVDVISSICPTDGTAGEIAYITKALELAYNLTGQVGEVFAFNVSGQGTSDLIRATVMENGAKTATGTGTARQLGAVAAGKSLYAAMHVIAVSGTTPTLDMVLQSDDAVGFLSPTSRITFAQATAIGAQWATPVAGPITDDWWRPSWTVGGTGSPSFTVVLVVGIQ